MLAVDYIEARIVLGQIEAFAGQASENLRESQARMDRRLAEQRQANEQRQQARIEAVEEKRRLSPLGREVYRRCVEFMRFYEDHPGDYALEQREKSCKAYRVYIETGRREADGP